MTWEHQSFLCFCLFSWCWVSEVPAHRKADQTSKICLVMCGKIRLYSSFCQQAVLFGLAWPLSQIPIGLLPWRCSSRNAASTVFCLSAGSRTVAHSTLTVDEQQISGLGAFVVHTCRRKYKSTHTLHWILGAKFSGWDLGLVSSMGLLDLLKILCSMSLISYDSSCCQDWFFYWSDRKYCSQVREHKHRNISQHDPTCMLMFFSSLCVIRHVFVTCSSPTYSNTMCTHLE